MTLTELITTFRNDVDDLAEPYLWSDTLVTSYANRAEIEACERRPLLTSSTDADMCRIAIVADLALYSKHTSVREVYYAKFTETTSGDEHRLTITNLDELTFRDPLWEDVEGDPTYLILDDTTVQLVPPPEVSGILEMSISYVPIIPLSTSGLISIDKAHHFNLKYWMLYLAYSKKDVDSHSEKKSLENEARFTRYFGDPKGANAIKSVRMVREDRERGGWI